MPGGNKCRACGAPMIWARMPSGRLNPLNVDQVQPEPGKGVVAFNPSTGRGVPVINANIDDCARWAERGVTFHTSHFSDCPERGRFQRPRELEQAILDVLGEVLLLEVVPVAAHPVIPFRGRQQLQRDAVVTPRYRAALIEHIAARFAIPAADVERDLDEVGMPILASNTVAAFDARYV